MKKKLLNGLLFLLALAALYYFGYYPKNVQPHRPADTQEISGKIPARIYEVLEHIDRYNRPPEGYEGGRRFGNYEKRLPVTDPVSGKKIRYREWDVNPKIPGKNRGAERLVTGNDKSAYYTRDHYGSFVKVRE